MKGIVFNIGRKADFGGFVSNVRYFFRRRGLALGFVLLITAGLATGCRLSAQIGDDALGRLDFLFVTNLPERLSGGFLSAFAAAFASDFLFFAAAFLAGICLWGAPVLAALAFFKGFGVGISAGYLIVSYGARGLMFYLCLLVPGLLIFIAAFVGQLCGCCEVYKRMLSALFRAGGGFGEHLLLYLKKSLVLLAVSLAASAVDAVLWIAFAGAFNM